MDPGSADVSRITWRGPCSVGAPAGRYQSQFTSRIFMYGPLKKIIVAFIAGAVTLVLIGMLMAGILSYANISQARADAQWGRQQAQKAVEFLTETSISELKDVPHSDLLKERLLVHAERDLAAIQGRGDRPDLWVSIAAAHDHLGRIRDWLGKLTDASHDYESAILYYK